MCGRAMAGFSGQVAIGLAVVVVWAGASQGGNTKWQYDPNATGDWFEPNNWTNGLPDIDTDVHVVDGGTARIETGVAESYSLQVGNAADGAVLQTGGQHRVYRRLFLGLSTETVGTYALTNGSLAIEENQAYVGYMGTGQFHQTGGSVSVHEYLYIGYAAASQGTYQLSGATSTLSVFSLYLGNSGDGNFQQTGGTVSLPLVPSGWGGAVSLGRDSGAEGTYDISAGRLECSYVEVGAQYTGRGLFRQTGGTVYVTRYVEVGANADNTGTYVLGNTGVLTTPVLSVGRHGSGDFLQSGGSLQVSNDIYIGKLGGSTGTWTISGGTVQAGRIGISSGPNPSSGTGSLTIVGASADIDCDNYSQGADGNLISRIDSAGISVITVAETATLAGGWTVLDDGAPFGWFNVLVAGTGISGAFDAVELPGPEWTWGIDNSETLWVRHVPEPATLSLLALGACLLARGRRGLARMRRRVRG